MAKVEIAHYGRNVVQSRLQLLRENASAGGKGLKGLFQGFGSKNQIRPNRLK